MDPSANDLRQSLLDKLRKYVEEKAANGIVQHSNEWLRNKQLTIGGSSLATIMGLNPYSSVAKLIGEKIGILQFNSDIKPQWGNLFEDVIKRFLEYDFGCEVLGEDLFVISESTPGLSYSPDGLAIMDVPAASSPSSTRAYFDDFDTPPPAPVATTTAPTTVLLEFKCPFTRVPCGRVPKYYVPQVKLGLQLLGIPTVGLFAEAVFRRCTWDQVGDNPDYDTVMFKHSKSIGEAPLAYGVLGFYFNERRYKALLEETRADPYNCTVESLEKEYTELMKLYIDYFAEAGTQSNDYICNDLGETPQELFVAIMRAFDKKIIAPWYGSILATTPPGGQFPLDEDSPQKRVRSVAAPATTAPSPGEFAAGRRATENTNTALLNADMAAFTEFCKEWDFISIGIVPWKLFRIDYHRINNTPGYVNQWLPKISDVLAAVKHCLGAQSREEMERLYKEVQDSGVKKQVTRAAFDDW